MKSILRLAAIAATIAVSASFATAQDLPSVEETYKEIEATYGVVPGFMKAYPTTAISGAWAMTKGLHFDEQNALDPKIKSLINLAVAAQIPCEYCI